MPRTFHDATGGLAKAGVLALQPTVSCPAGVANRVPDAPGRWKYPAVRRSRWILASSALFSIGLHALVLLGFNERKPVVKPAQVADEPVIQITLPDLQEEEVDPVEDLGEEPMETPAIAVPLLADVPSIVPIDAFVQPLDFTPALPASLDAMRVAAVPVNVARNSGTAERLGKIFEISQLDRQPSPLFQPAPIFPPELLKEYRESTVRMEFIITSKGEVIAPRVIASEHRRFEESAIQALEKWKFRPGYKGGRAVNTRTQISIRFVVTAL